MAGKRDQTAKGSEGKEARALRSRGRSVVVL